MHCCRENNATQFKYAVVAMQTIPHSLNRYCSYYYIYANYKNITQLKEAPVPMHAMPHSLRAVAMQTIPHSLNMHPLPNTQHMAKTRSSCHTNNAT